MWQLYKSYQNHAKVINPKDSNCKVFQKYSKSCIFDTACLQKSKHRIFFLLCEWWTGNDVVAVMVYLRVLPHDFPEELMEKLKP
jgi:hypothetical protein